MITAFPGKRWITTLAAAFISFVASGIGTSAFAEKGQATDWQLGMQTFVTDIGDQINDFHDLLLYIITAIVIFVFLLLVWVLFRYNEKANPTPSKTSHNTMIEVIWTVVPILILLLIAIPSFRVLSNQYTIPKSDVVLKAIGNQWYWSYAYPDAGIEFDSNYLKDDEIKKARAAGEQAPRLLAVDNPIVVPVNKVVYVHVSASDVLHNWTIPSFGVKMDAIPGSPKLIWFKAREEGTYYGQCSEMCGVNHAFMPIEVRVVKQEVYDQWLAAMKQGEDAGKAVLKQAALELKQRKEKTKTAQVSTAGQ